jgi:hypothetical protein
MEPPVTVLLGALLEAQVSVRVEMERLAEVRPLDRAALRRLRGAAHDLADQADTLLLTLVMQDAPGPLVTAVEEIFDAFRDAERQIEDVTRRRRGKGRARYIPCAS